MKEKFILMMLKDLEDLQNGKLDVNHLHNSLKNIEKHIQEAFEFAGKNANLCVLCGANDNMVDYAIMEGMANACEYFINQSLDPNTNLYITSVCVLESLKQLMISLLE